MITVFGYEIGMFSFFVFSILAGVVIALQAAFGCKDETTRHRIIRGLAGVAYTAVAIAAFMQLHDADSAYGDSPYIEQFLPFVTLVRRRRN